MDEPAAKAVARFDQALRRLRGMRHAAVVAGYPDESMEGILSAYQAGAYAQPSQWVCEPPDWQVT